MVLAGSNVVAKVTRGRQRRADGGDAARWRQYTGVGDTGRQEPARHRRQPRRYARLYDELYLARCTVIDLSSSPRRRWARFRSADLPPGRRRERHHAAGQRTVQRLGRRVRRRHHRAHVEQRLASVFVVPFRGVTNGVVWQFPAGPRKSIPLNATFSPKAPDTDQRVLNYSGIFDEVCDFEINIRNVSGGAGLIITDTVVPPPRTRCWLRSTRLIAGARG